MIRARPAKLALLLIFVMTPPALAADWDADATRNIGAPDFLPYAGELKGSFTYTYSADTYDFDTNQPFTFPRSNDKSTNAFLPDLTYGITDDIAVFADLGWGNSRNSEAYTYNRTIFGLPIRVVPTHAHASFRALGADDPSFGATWRAIDERYAPVNIDLSASYQPDIFRARSSGTLQAGSLAAGGQAGSVQAAISRAINLLTLRAYGTFSYAGRRNDSARYGTEILRSAPHATYAAGLQSAVRLLPFLTLNAGVQAQQAMQYDQFAILSQYVSPVTIKPSGSISPYVGVVLPIVPQRLFAEFLYQHDFVNNQTQELASGQVQRYYKQQSNEYTARILFTFGGPSPSAPPPPAPNPPPPIRAPIIDRTYLVFFDWDRADLSTRARQIVVEAAQAIAHVQTTRIEVDGYTDLSGTAAYNQRLSVRRAHAVETELVRDGVSQSEITIHGYGEQHPLVSTAPGVREPQNRRVEIIWR